MSGRYYYLISCKNPGKVLDKFRERFNSPELGKTTEDNKILLLSSDFDTLSNPGEGGIGEDSIWYEVSGDIDWMLNIAWNDTSNVTYGTLYKIKNGDFVDIDHEYGHLYPFTGGEKDDIGDHVFQGHSHVPAYFYRVHGIKIFDQYPSELSDINFENTYMPKKDVGLERTCPSCETHDISVDGWEAKCEICGFKDTEVWFSQYSSDIAKLHKPTLEQENSKTEETNKYQNLGILGRLFRLIGKRKNKKGW